jgi:hypothetical protein
MATLRLIRLQRRNATRFARYVNLRELLRHITPRTLRLCTRERFSIDVATFCINTIKCRRDPAAVR